MVGVPGGGYLHALELMPWWLVCPCGWCAWWWLPACLGGSCLGACALVGVLGGGYLHALNLMPCWLVW